MTSAAHTGRTCILVAGMHRSGTSALTRMLSLLGGTLPDNLMPPSAEYNPAGFWESRDVVALDDAVLRAVGSRWNDVLPFHLDALPAADAAAFHHAVGQLCDTQFRDARLFIVKDPRLARLLGLWVAALRALDIAPRVVLPYRHPLEVAASLARRDGLSSATSVQLWLRHMFDVLALDATVPRVLVGYEELLSDWNVCAARIAQELGLSWPRCALEAQPDIDAFLQPGLRHHNALHQGTPAGLPELDLALELYAALAAPADTAAAVAAPLRVRFDALQAGVAPLLQDLRSQRRQDESELAALRVEFDIKCRHVAQLDATMQAERETFRRLEREFDAKCTHVTALLAEVASLRAMHTPGASASSGDLHAGLAEIETLLLRRQAALRERRERDERGRQQCRTDIVRAEAQLDLLKNLFLDD